MVALGGQVYIGGAGGGGVATDARVCSRTAASCPNGVPSVLTRLIVAAGGGGAGGCQPGTCRALGGPGGSAGQPGGVQPSGQGGRGGGAGTLVAPGGAGAPYSYAALIAMPGDDYGNGGQGAASGSASGGGGGGGYFGGGGGGWSLASGWTTGGGGGANFASPLAVSGVTFALGDGKPRLLITPRPASAIRISRIYYNSPAPTRPPTRASPPSSSG